MQDALSAVDTAKQYFEKMRSDEESKRFYEKTVKAAEELEIGEPELPRQRKRPSRYESESSHIPCSRSILLQYLF